MQGAPKKRILITEQMRYESTNSSIEKKHLKVQLTENQEMELTLSLALSFSCNANNSFSFTSRTAFVDSASCNQIKREDFSQIIDELYFKSFAVFLKPEEPSMGQVLRLSMEIQTSTVLISPQHKHQVNSRYHQWKDANSGPCSSYWDPGG